MNAKTKKLLNPTKTRFIRWLKSQRSDKTWNYFDHDRCPFACFLRSLGYRKVRVGGWKWRAEGVKDTDIPDDVWTPLTIAGSYKTSADDILKKFVK